MSHGEPHKSHRIGWLRASVLGANDGIVSTASLIIGVTAANATLDSILLAGMAGLVAGATSMAAGEYVSVSSQSDTEQADLALERKSLAQNPEFEKNELAEIYESRGLAAFFSALTFTLGASLPMLVVWFSPIDQIINLVALCSLVFLALLGGLAARVGGASIAIGATRVTFWGALAMALTAGVGRIFGIDG
ncbi:UNVERIFIED_CONTAM: hypothetical protein GTU68_058264 [Idotea baltica]|nr:hypothetical protein [Idotea baltica]